MRIISSEIKALVLAISPFLEGNNAELRLYGSRVKDNLKGGDLDILLLVENENLAHKIKMKQHYVLYEIKKRLGDRKIDLLIAARDAILHDAFLNLIFPESVVLHQWYC